MLQISKFSVVTLLCFAANLSFASDTLKLNSTLKNFYELKLQTGFGLNGPARIIENSITGNDREEIPLKLYLIRPLNNYWGIRSELQFSYIRMNLAGRGIDLSEFYHPDSLGQFEDKISVFSSYSCYFRNDYELHLSAEKIVFKNFPYFRTGAGLLLGYVRSEFFQSTENFFVNNSPVFEIVNEEHYFTISSVKSFKTGIFLDLSLSCPISEHFQFTADVYFNFVGSFNNKVSWTNDEPAGIMNSRYRLFDFRLILHPSLVYVF